MPVCVPAVYSVPCHSVMISSRAWLRVVIRPSLYYVYATVIASEASSQSEPHFAKARELLFNVWGLEQAVSRKLSIFDIWCIEEKVFVFT